MGCSAKPKGFLVASLLAAVLSWEVWGDADGYQGRGREDGSGGASLDTHSLQHGCSSGTSLGAFCPGILRKPQSSYSSSCTRTGRSCVSQVWSHPTCCACAFLWPCLPFLPLESTTGTVGRTLRHPQLPGQSSLQLCQFSNCPLPRGARASQCNSPQLWGVPTPHIPLLPTQHLSALSQGTTATCAWHCAGATIAEQSPPPCLPGSCSLFQDLRVAERAGLPSHCPGLLEHWGTEPGEMGWGWACHPSPVSWGMPGTVLAGLT